MTQNIHVDDDDCFRHFSEALRSEMFRHYIGLQHRIRLELELLGVTVLSMDFCDDNYWLETEFATWNDVARFSELTEGADYTGDWDAEERTNYQFGPTVTLCMPRADAFPTWETLNRLAEATVDCERRARLQLEYEQRLGLPMARWGEHCPRPRPIDTPPQIGECIG